MQELIRTRCAQGWLVITDEFIRIELRGSFSRQTTLYRSMLTGIDSRVTMPTFFGLTSGAAELIFHGQGTENLKATMVKLKVAQEIVGLLQHPQH
jgi:hypothetical protein